VYDVLAGRTYMFTAGRKFFSKYHDALGMTNRQPHAYTKYF